MLLSAATIAWIIMTKPDATSAVAWGMVVVFLPFLGPLLFYFFGYQHVSRPLRRKRRHKLSYTLFNPRRAPDAAPGDLPDGDGAPPDGHPWQQSLSTRMAWLADRFGAYPLTRGNHVDFYHDGPPAYEAMLQAIEGAKHHVHLQTFILRADEAGERFL